MQEQDLVKTKYWPLQIIKMRKNKCGYLVWATDVPQAVISFLSRHDLSGKTVIPFCTYDGYGAGSSYRTISEASHAGQTLDGLAIEASDVPVSKDTVSQWLW